MAKSNPLFVDSTKLHGERIATQIELTKVLLHDEESVVVTVRNSQGEVSRLPMKAMENGETFQARVWLGHQEPITYWFTIEKETTALLHMKPKQSRAQYAIIEPWDPVADGEVFEIPESIEVAPAVPRHSTAIAKHASNLSALVEKWGL